MFFYCLKVLALKIKQNICMQVKLSTEDIEKILNILIYDGKIERIPSGDKNLYKSIQPLVNLPGLIRNPCGLCPVRYITNILCLLQ